MNILRLSFLVLSPVAVACTELPEGNWKEISPDIAMSLDIDDDHHLSAYAGCNRLMGSARIEGRQLVVEHFASTRMMCYGEAAKNEKALITLLTSKPEVQLHGEQLTLSTNTNSYTFRKQQTQSTGVTRIVHIASQTVGCTGVVPMECLQTREHENDPWMPFYGAIERFQHQPGTAYRLRVTEYDTTQPFLADAPNPLWVVDEILEQKQVNSH